MEANVNNLFDILKKKSIALRTESIKCRKARLRQLRDWIHANRPAIQSAIHADFKRHPLETDSIEILNVLVEIKHALSHLDQWTASKKVDAPITLWGTRSYIQYEPRGVSLILSPWNYPFLLCAGPLVSAIAAGNTVMLKPSELTPTVSREIKRMSEEVFEASVVTTVEGGADIAQQLLKLPFDHIFFTGSPSVGKLVMKAAAENLSSVTLELGGKSPSIVTSTADVNEAAERTAVAKFVNNGQTCIAPDYILVDEKISTPFIEALEKHTKRLFSDNNGSFDTSPYYCRIVNDKNFSRLKSLLDDAVMHGANLVYGGSTDPATKFIHPTILTGIPAAARIMHEEIFGPILPVVSYRKLEEAVEYVNERPKPLALYIFSESKKDQRNILTGTSSGGVCINDNAIHFLHQHLPFGGVNTSGLGKSHGYYGFLAFSNEKPVLKQRHGFTTIKTFYPPYTKWSRRLMEWFLKLF